MAQAQAVKPKSVQREVTQQQSLSLMKNLFRASLSEVCYLRNLFPEDCFRPTSFGNTTIRALVPREAGADGKPTGRIINEDAARLLAWQDAAFEALELGYLRCIIFAIYSGEERPADRQLLESYVYHFKYPQGKDVEMTLSKDSQAFTLSRVRDQAVGMVRTLIRLCETMRPVPDQRVVSLKLFYYDDKAPADYQPTYFSDATHEEHLFYDTAPLKVTAGSVTSKHHGLTLKVAFREDMAAPQHQEEAAAAAAAQGAAAASSAASGGASSTSSAPANATGADSEEAAVATVTSLPVAASAAGAPAASSAADDDTDGTDGVPLPEGVSSSLYAEAVQLIVTTGACSAAALRNGLADAGTSTSNEQVRRILKHAAACGYLVPAGPNRYALGPAAVMRAAAAGAGAGSSSVGVAEGADAAAADAASTLQPSLIYARTLVTVLHSWAGGGGGAPGAATRTHVRVPDLEKALGVDTATAKTALDAMEAEGLLLPTGANGAPKSKGRAIAPRTADSDAKLGKAANFLTMHGLAAALPPRLAAWWQVKQAAAAAAAAAKPESEYDVPSAQQEAAAAAEGEEGEASQAPPPTAASKGGKKRSAAGAAAAAASHVKATPAPREPAAASAAAAANATTVPVKRHLVMSGAETLPAPVGRVSPPSAATSSSSAAAAAPSAVSGAKRKFAPALAPPASRSSDASAVAAGSGAAKAARAGNAGLQFGASAGALARSGGAGAGAGGKLAELRGGEDPYRYDEY